MGVLLPTFEIRVTRPSGEVHLVKAITQISVNLSSEKPCDTAEVHIPTTKKAHLDLFKPEGDVKPEIEISLGYIGQKPELTKIFAGDIVWVSPNLPLVVKAEDVFGRARHRFVNETYCKGGKREYYSHVAKDLLDKAGIKSVHIPMEKKDTDWEPHSLEIAKQTVAQAMAKLSEETQWVHFCIPGTRKIYFGPDWPHLQGHLPDSDSPATPDVLAYRIGSGREGTKPADNQDETPASPASPPNKFPGTWGNIISASGLKYRTEKPYSKVICNLVDREQRNTSVSGSYPAEENEYEGSAEGQEHSFTEPFSYKNKDKAKLHAQARAEKKFNELNSAQYEGSFTTFGNPLLSHSQTIWLESVEHPAYSGYYDARSVSFNYSPTGGFRMTVEVRKPPADKLQAAGYRS